MTVSRTIRRHIERGDFAALEDDWLARQASEETDLDYFVGVARALAGSGEQERARFLIEMLDEQLAGGERWSRRLDLLRRAGELLHDPPPLHAEILATLRGLYAGFPSLEGLMEKVGLHRAIEDTAKSWEKVARLRDLLGFEQGTIVWMEGKGAGRVVEVNLELESFKVDFPGFPGLRAGFAAAAKVLTPLAPGHILRRKLEDPEALRELSRGHPGDLLVEALKSYEQPLAAGEIRTILEDIVSAEEWSSWWSAARRHPQIIISGRGGRQTYGWAASGEGALEAVRRDFADAGAGKKLEIYRRNAERDPDLRREMAAELCAQAEKQAATRPDLAFAVFAQLDRFGDAPETAAWSPGALFERAADPAALVASIDDRMLRERALAELRRHRDDWLDSYAALLTSESEPRLLDHLAEAIAAEDASRLDSFADRVLGQPRKQPAAFVWLAERLADHPRLLERNPQRILQQLLDALRHNEFASLRPRLKRLFESGGPVPALLSNLDETQAEQTDLDIRRAPLDDYLRTPLLNALHLRFPALHERAAEPLYALPGSIEAKRSELRQLLEEEIPANRLAIEEARALGDLRENFEYKAARQRHEYLAARATALKQQLDRAVPIDLSAAGSDEARVGCCVELEADDGERRAVTLLGPWESDPERDVLSYESPLGGRIVGCRVGERVEIDGRGYRLRDVQPIPEPSPDAGGAGSGGNSISTASPSSASRTTPPSPASSSTPSSPASRRSASGEG